MTYAEKHFVDLYPLVFNMGITFVMEPIAPINDATAQQLVKRIPVDHAVVYGIYLIGEKTLIDRLEGDVSRDMIINGLVTTMICANHGSPIAYTDGKCVIHRTGENKLLNKISETNEEENERRFNDKIDNILCNKQEEHLDKIVVYFGTVNVLINTANHLRGQLNSVPASSPSNEDELDEEDFSEEELG